MFEKLFTPIRIRGLELKNRAVMSAMGTHESAASADKKSVTDKLIEYHVVRAKGGCGLNTVEVTAVDAASSPEGFLSLADDKYIAGFKKLNDAVHAAGGKTCVQLWQGGLAVASDRNAEILLPCDMPLSAEYTCPGITTERLLSVIEAFGEAARRAVEAGFDSLEFHCAHNYLPHSMLSGGINHRTDEWGGSFENREKFPLACIRAIRANMPDDMPLFMRIDCHDDMLEGGLTVEEVIAFCKDAGKAGVDVLNISRGNILTAATLYEVAPVTIPNGFNVEDAARIRKETGMLTMPCGRINTPEMAEEILEKDQADLVVLARAQLADPEFCNKAQAGKVDEIKYCLGCNQGCYDYFVAALYSPDVEHITCTRNPALMEEAALSLTPAKTPKKVVVVGGGIGGMEAACNLKLTGNTPVLYEASEKLGGNLLLSGVSPDKTDFALAGEKAAKRVSALGVEVKLSAECTVQTLKEEAPAGVILAIGSEPAPLSLPVSENAQVVDCVELMQGKEVGGKTAVVLGGNLIGIECARYLKAKGFTVSVTEENNPFFQDLGQLRRITNQIAVATDGIQLLAGASATRIGEGEVLLSTPEGEQTLQADLVVNATGMVAKKASDLENYCKENGMPCYVIPSDTILHSIHAAYLAVLDLNKQ